MAGDPWRWLCTLVAACCFSIATTQTRELGQADPRDESSSPHEPSGFANVRVSTLTDHTGELGRIQVRVVNAAVARTFDRGVFLIRQTDHHPGFDLSAPRAVVLVPERQVAAPDGTAVVVVGRVRTYEGAVRSGDVPWLEGLTPRVQRRLRRAPIIVASSVQTPDGIELVAR